VRYIRRLWSAEHMARVTRAARTRARVRVRASERAGLSVLISPNVIPARSFALDAARISRASRNAAPRYLIRRIVIVENVAALDYRDTRRALSLFVALPLISPAKIQRPAPRAAALHYALRDRRIIPAAFDVRARSARSERRRSFR